MCGLAVDTTFVNLLDLSKGSDARDHERRRRRPPQPLLGYAVHFIDAVRTKEAKDGPFGAGLAAYAGSTDADALRRETFVQRSAELRLQSLRLADSRRLSSQSARRVRTGANVLLVLVQQRNPNMSGDLQI